MALTPLQPKRPMDFAILAGVCLFMGAFTSHGLSPDSDNLFPPYVSAIFALILYAAGLGALLGALLLAWIHKDGSVAVVAFLSLILGGAMAGVVQNEPENFYGAVVGIVSSLILALVANHGKIQFHRGKAQNLKSRKPDKNASPKKSTAGRTRTSRESKAGPSS